MPADTSTIAPLLLDARAAARLLSISTRTLWTMTQPRGPIPAVRIGTRVLYSAAALEAWIKTHLAEARS